MELHIDTLEAIWIVSNSIALGITFLSLLDAYESLGLALAAGTARQLIAHGNVRREWFRLIVQGLLISIVIPGIFTDRPTPLSVFVVILLSVPILLMVSSALDYRERKKLESIVWSDIDTERKRDETE